MNSIPAYHENTETFALAPMQSFDAESSVSTPGQRARVRPAARPRPSAADISADALQLFEDPAKPSPEST